MTGWIGGGQGSASGGGRTLGTIRGSSMAGSSSCSTIHVTAASTVSAPVKCSARVALRVKCQLWGMPRSPGLTGGEGEGSDNLLVGNPMSSVSCLRSPASTSAATCSIHAAHY